jgi:hypothetical protein
VNLEIYLDAFHLRHRTTSSAAKLLHIIPALPHFSTFEYFERFKLAGVRRREGSHGPSGEELIGAGEITRLVAAEPEKRCSPPSPHWAFAISGLDLL